jgi:hypothetical protein
MQETSPENVKIAEGIPTEKAGNGTATEVQQQSTIPDSQVSYYDWQANYSTILNKSPIETKPYIPNRFRSGFMYVVLENELNLRNKRRIVSLSSDDLLYASVTGKCVFIQIDWKNDFTNTLKVHESNHTWETTFSELIDTRPVALRHLFARSEVWAEGHYEPLSG